MDDKRVTVDFELRQTVLNPIADQHGIPMIDLVYLFTTLAISKNLEPMPPKKREVLSGDVFVELPIYQIVAAQFNSKEPRRLAHELANAGMAYVMSRFSDESELIDIFDLRQQSAPRGEV
jgi:hypothetical protein